METNNFSAQRIIFGALISVLLAGTGCTSATTGEAGEVRVSDVSLAPTVETVVELEVFKKSRPCSVDLNVNRLGDGSYQLTAQLEFESDSYVVSPSDLNDWTGPFNLYFDESADLKVTGSISEWPAPVSHTFSFQEAPVLINDTSTFYGLPFTVLHPGDFEVTGAAFFVFEPLCIPFARKFTLQMRSGELDLRVEPLAEAFDLVEE